MNWLTEIEITEIIHERRVWQSLYDVGIYYGRRDDSELLVLPNDPENWRVQSAVKQAEELLEKVDNELEDQQLYGPPISIEPSDICVDLDDPNCEAALLEELPGRIAYIKSFAAGLRMEKNAIGDERETSAIFDLKSPREASFRSNVRGLYYDYDNLLDFLASKGKELLGELELKHDQLESKVNRKILRPCDQVEDAGTDPWFLDMYGRRFARPEYPFDDEGVPIIRFSDIATPVSLPKDLNSAQERCPCCLEQLSFAPNLIYQLPCGHQTHGEDCLGKWVNSRFENHNSCPLCLKEFTPARAMQNTEEFLHSYNSLKGKLENVINDKHDIHAGLAAIRVTCWDVWMEQKASDEFRYNEAKKRLFEWKMPERKE